MGGSKQEKAGFEAKPAFFLVYFLVPEVGIEPTRN
jgi:hypothetical protein